MASKSKKNPSIEKISSSNFQNNVITQRISDEIKTEDMKIKVFNWNLENLEKAIKSELETWKLEILENIQKEKLEQLKRDQQELIVGLEAVLEESDHLFGEDSDKSIQKEES